MSQTATADLGSFSNALVDLVASASRGVVAVKMAPHRVVSGIALEANLVAISNHSLRREGQIDIQALNGSEGHATILGRDAGVDLAVLKVEGVELQPLPHSDPTSLKPGMLAAVVGLTDDVGPSASLGILGAVGAARRTWRGGTLDQFLRLDVNLYPSQSGAAVVDIEGRLIGLATPALSRHAAVAVPASTLTRIAQELLREGRIRHGYLGVGLQPVGLPESLSRKLEIDSRSGLILLSVEPESPADKAGLQIGDIIVQLDGKRINDIDELQSALRGDAVGKTLSVLILRGGQTLTQEVLVAERVGRDR